MTPTTPQLTRAQRAADVVTDAEAIRFTHQNDRLCDHARPDEQAGLHKHVINAAETHGLNHCVACGRIWEPKQTCLCTGGGLLYRDTNLPTREGPGLTLTDIFREMYPCDCPCGEPWREVFQEEGVKWEERTAA